MMKYRHILNRFTVIMIAAAVALPLASCSIFARKDVIEAADKLGVAITKGSAEDITALSAKKHKQFKEDLDMLIAGGGYTEEENLYADAVRSTMRYEVDESSVIVDGEKASCDIVITLADYSKLTDGDFDTISDLTAAVGTCDTYEVTFTAEFSKKDDEWRVDNLNSEEFLKIFEYRNAEFTIGKASLIATAEVLAGYISEGTADDLISLSYDPVEEGTLEFLLAEDMTGDEIDFADAVRNTFDVSVQTDSVMVDGLYGTCDLVITMADYETISQENYGSLSDLLSAVAKSGTIEYTFTAEFLRTDDTWLITNLGSTEFEDIFKYRYLVLSISDFSGPYAAKVDVTDKFNTKIEEYVGAGAAKNMTGSIIATVELELNKDGTYSFGIDRDTFADTLYDYADTNIDTLVLNMLGATSTDQIELLVKLAGYKDYAELRNELLDEVTSMLDGLSTSGLDREGNYMVSNGTITFYGSDDTTSTDDIVGTIDTYGAVTLTAPITDPDAVMLFGADEITLVFYPEN